MKARERSGSNKAHGRDGATAVLAEPARTGNVPRPSESGQTASTSTTRHGLSYLLHQWVRFFSSLRLTVVLLCLGMVLIFTGTMAQDPLGLFPAQERFFRSFFVSGAAMWAAIKKTLEMAHVYLPPSTLADVNSGSRFPVFPGGYLVGGLLLINLVTAHFMRFKWTRKKAGIWIIHFGIILLLFGQLLTDVLSRETSLHLREGETRNYSEADRQTELAIIDVSAPEADQVIAIADRVLAHRKEIEHAALPFKVRVKDYFPNSFVDNRTADSLEPPASTRGVGTRAVVREAPRVTDMNRRDVPSAVVELIGAQGSLGTWLVSEYINPLQKFDFDNRSWQISLRARRYYKPHSIQLLKFQHDLYPGTDIPKNFSSQVVLNHPETGEKREVLIYMNNPLRYAGETYYQASFDPDNRGTILQVVHNPSWLTPYFSCVLVAAGLIVQFSIHLVGFIRKQKPSTVPA